MYKDRGTPKVTENNTRNTTKIKETKPPKTATNNGTKKREIGERYFGEEVPLGLKRGSLTVLLITGVEAMPNV